MRNTNAFIRWWLTVFISTLVVLLTFGFVPKKLKEFIAVSYSLFTAKSAVSAVEEKIAEPEPPPKEITEIPTRLVISSVGINYDVVTPTNTTIEELDRSLQDGVVHYPGSGLLGEDANVLLFGHSSHLKYVRNLAYKALTGIENIKEGDSIDVYGTDHVFRYKVLSIRLVKKDQELIQFGGEERRLTISTCNTFGSKDDRYVVEAEFFEKAPLLDGGDTTVIEQG